MKTPEHMQLTASDVAMLRQTLRAIYECLPAPLRFAFLVAIAQALGIDDVATWLLSSDG